MLTLGNQIVRRMCWLAVVLVAAVAVLWYVFWKIERPKVEYSVLQRTQSEATLPPGDKFKIIQEGDMSILVVRGDVGKYVAVLLNAKSEPYYKQVPSNVKFHLTAEEWEAIQRSATIHEEVLKVKWETEPSYGLPLEIAKKKGFRKIVELLEAEVIIKK